MQKHFWVVTLPESFTSLLLVVTVTTSTTEVTDFERVPLAVAVYNPNITKNVGRLHASCSRTSQYRFETGSERLTISISVRLH